MQLLDETPRLPKSPFIIGDAVLLLAAAYIASRADSPLGTGPLLAISICVGLGAILAVIPFLVDYARRQDEALEERQQALAALSREISASAEQISIAVASIPTLAQHATQSGKLAEQLPRLIQDKIHQLKEALAESADTEAETLRQDLAALRAAESDKLSDVVDKLDRNTFRLIELLVRWEQLPAQTEAATKELQSALKTVAQYKPAPAPESAPTAPAPEPIPDEPTADPTPEPEPVADAEPEPAAAPEPEPEPEASTEPTPEPEPEPIAAAPKPPPRRKAPPPIDDNPDLFETKASTDDEPAEDSTARSADGATRLIVTAYIGIGNKLYIRGEGPGLHPDQGVPLQFISIGKWRWETDHADTPLKIRLYKNDQIECTALGEVVLQPEHQHEVSATF